MKKFPRTFQGILILLLVLFLVISLAVTRLTAATDPRLGAAAILLQTTPTPQVEDASEIGSTDGIVLMGVIIVLIVVVPIMLRRKSWSQN